MEGLRPVGIEPSAAARALWLETRLRSPVRAALDQADGGKRDRTSGKPDPSNESKPIEKTTAPR